MWKYYGSISQLGFFLFFILFFLSSFHFQPYISFLFLFFSFSFFLLHTRVHYLYPPSFIFLFSLIQNILGSSILSFFLQLSLSLSLSLPVMWSKCEMLECSWGEKENKRRGAGHLKNKKKKKEKKKWNVYGWKWNERKKNNIKKKILIEKYYHNIFTIILQ